MHEGSDLKAYRQTLAMSQTAFAAELNISQASLSLIESGKNSLTNAVRQSLLRKFKPPKYSLAYLEFTERLHRQRATGHGLVGHDALTHVSLPVWQWEPGFDLAMPPAAVNADGLVTVRRNTNAAIAVVVEQPGRAWSPGEILVFAPIELNDCRSGDLCLLQRQRDNEQPLSTWLALAQVNATGRHREVTFDLVYPEEGETIADADRITALLRCVYRGRYAE